MGEFFCYTSFLCCFKEKRQKKQAYVPVTRSTQYTPKIPSPQTSLYQPRYARLTSYGHEVSVAFCMAILRTFLMSMGLVAPASDLRGSPGGAATTGGFKYSPRKKKNVPFVFPEEFGKKLEKEPRLCFAQQSWFSRLPIFWQFQRKQKNNGGEFFFGSFFCLVDKRKKEYKKSSPQASLFVVQPPRAVLKPAPEPLRAGLTCFSSVVSCIPFHSQCYHLHLPLSFLSVRQR